MDFIKRMKKREFLEMVLKMLSAVFIAFVAVILMEGMIYSIELNAYRNNGTSSVFYSNSTVMYCIEESDDQYFVLFYNEGYESEWSATSTMYSKADIEDLGGETVYYHAPNAFLFSITWVHYIVIAVFMLVVVGYFIYKFVRLDLQYRKIISDYETTGEIEFEV